MKKCFSILLVATGAILLAACASQPQDTQDTSNAHQTTQQDKLVKVCHKETHTGSHLSKIHCMMMTKNQYEAYKKAKEKQREKAQEEMTRRNQHMNPTTGGPR